MPQPRFGVLMLYTTIIFIKSLIRIKQDYENLKKFLCPNGSCFGSVLVSCLGIFCWLCMSLQEGMQHLVGFN